MERHSCFPGGSRRVGSSRTKPSSHLKSGSALHRALIVRQADDYIGKAGARLVLAHSGRVSHTQTLI